MKVLGGMCMRYVLPNLYSQTSTYCKKACSTHMQELIASVVYGGNGSVEAVEAFLILAEWVPRRPHSAPSIGKGEEDHQAWMLVGMAVRLGYLLGLDRTGFRNEGD